MSARAAYEAWRQGQTLHSYDSFDAFEAGWKAAKSEHEIFGYIRASEVEGLPEGTLEVRSDDGKILLKIFHES